MYRGPERRDVDGWGTSVELAGVVQLLDAVASGAIEVTAVRQALVREADIMDERLLEDAQVLNPGLTRESMRCFGDCPRCQSNRDEVRKLLDEAARRRARLQEPDRYAVAVSGSSVHRLDCSVVRKSARTLTRRGGDEREGDLFAREVHRFTHNGTGPGLPHLALTLDEYDRWRGERTGSQGGLRYRLCKLCDPPVPLA